MLRKLGGSAGAPDRASSSTDDDGRVRTDDTAGVHHRPTDADYHKGGRPGRNPNAAANSDKPCPDANWPCATDKPEHADGAVPDYTCDAHGAKWKPGAAKRDYGRCACPDTDCGAGRATFEYSGGSHKQSRNQSACKFREYARTNEFGWHYPDQSGNDSEWNTVPGDPSADRDAESTSDVRWSRKSTYARARRGPALF